MRQHNGFLYNSINIKRLTDNDPKCCKYLNATLQHDIDCINLFKSKLVVEFCLPGIFCSIYLINNLFQWFPNFSRLLPPWLLGGFLATFQHIRKDLTSTLDYIKEAMHSFILLVS